MPPDAISAIPGLRVGHWTNRRAATGCTVVLCEGGAVAPVAVRGGAPGTLALGTTRSAQHAGSRLMPLPGIPATILCGAPLDEDGNPIVGERALWGWPWLATFLHHPEQWFIQEVEE